MTERAKPWPADHKAERAARVQAALRENLKRRKAQARARSRRPDEPDAPHDSAGIPGDKDT